MLTLNMSNYDLVIIGSGPGGYVAAIESSRLGLKTALIEKDFLGGTCLNKGCIPSKSLLKSAEFADSLQNKAKNKGFSFDNLSIDYPKIIDNSKKNTKRLKSGLTSLLSKKNIDILDGEASFVSKNTLKISSSSGNQNIQSNKILIATGSRPFYPKILKPNGRTILDSEDVLNSTSLPNDICIIGGGYIGIEFAYLYSSFGVKVTIIETADTILSSIDKEVVDLLKKSYKKRGIRILESTNVASVTESTESISLKLSNSESTMVEDFNCVLLATGRIPNTSGLNLESAGVVTDKFGFIKVNDDYSTNIDSIYAIGDVIGGLMLAHKASEEGSIVANNIFQSKNTQCEELQIPACIYSQPEIAYIGLTEDVAKNKKVSYKVVSYPFKANGKSLADDNSTGFCKILINQSEMIIGAHIIGKGSTEMISEIALLMQNNLSIDSIAKTIHPHPTLSEIILEASLSLKGRPRNF